MKKFVFSKIILVVVFIVAFTHNAYAEGKKVNLDWESKFTYDGTVAVRFLSVQIKNRKLVFDALIHNTEKSNYMCVWLSTSENAVHMDDELGNAYKGAKFTLKPSDNKFAPNQRKRLTIELPEPDPEVKIVNIHLGFGIDDINSSPASSCGKSIRSDSKLNFHKLDWNIEDLR
ncbi:MAG: hypothetical protein GY756_06655 [bacterium]|nr:hypothetical protein [bacterium]